MLTTRSAESGNRWDDEGADWARGGGIFGKAGGVTWAREAEVKHGRVCMLAATGAVSPCPSLGTSTSGPAKPAEG